MDSSNMQKDFSHANSRAFEELIRELFKLEFNINDSDIILTPMTRDGGKDVEISFEHNLVSLPTIDYKIWIEAKLKKKSNKVELNDIAGNVIIAFNSNVKAIYFITTSYFTQQTYKELILNKLKTGLNITLIDGFNLRNLLNKWDKKIKKQRKFISEIRKILPIEKHKIVDDIIFYIDNDAMELKASIGKEKKITSRKINISPIIQSEEKYDLSKIETNFSITKEDVDSNLLYKLTGDRRERLFNEIIYDIENFKSIILTGETGQGKTFFAHHLIRYFQNQDWTTFLISVSNDNIISFTKKLLLKFINLDYSDLEENYDEIVKCIYISFNVKVEVAKQIIKVLKSNTQDENIAPDICLELLKKSLISCSKRKHILLVIDDLECIETELLSFLINFFNNLKETDISILSIIKSIQTDICLREEKDKLFKYHNMLNIQGYSQFIILPLNNTEENELIEGMLPGANINIIKIIKENTLPVPLYIQLFIEYLIQKSIIVSQDGKYWVLNNTSVLIDNSEIQSNKISTLIINLLKCYFENKIIKKTAIYLYLLNNRISTYLIKILIPEWTEAEIDGTLFMNSYLEKQNHIKFGHFLFYDNIPLALEQATDTLRYHAEKLINSEHVKKFDDAVKGKLFEHAGLFQSAYKAYLNYGNAIRKIDSYESMINYEKALKNFLEEPGVITNYNEYTSLLCELAFNLLLFYNKYNLLHTYNSSRLYSILARYQSYFSLENSLYYLYYMGQRETKQENFEEAHKYYSKAKQEVYINSNLSEDIVVKIINTYGISLKHLGRRYDSMAFFEESSQKWTYKNIQVEKNSDLAAYYLTTDPARSLKYFSFIQNNLSHSSVHLDIDIAMANFYIGNYDKSEKQLQKAVIRAKNTINLSEQARALNIIGLLKWLKNDYTGTENYLDSALAVGELANNHRWIWRIWSNISQISCVNKNNDKAYNIAYALINHIDKTKKALLRELESNSVNSRRYAALKAAIYVLFQLQKMDEIDELINSRFIEIKKYTSSFYKKLSEENIAYNDKDDSNFYPNNKAYFILG